MVRSYAADNATVVVGTVLDPNVHDELRVTVVATGLGREERLGEASMTPVSAAVAASPAGKTTIAETIEIDRSKRKREQRQYDEKSPNYLDIPAFLRRQAD